MDDTSAATELAQSLGIPIVSPQFGISKGEYSYDALNKVISKGIGSIKSLNVSVGDQLFEYASKEHPRYFVDFLESPDHGSANKTQIQILIDLDYFRNFGNANALTVIFERYQKLDKKSININDFSTDVANVLLKSCRTLKKDGKPLAKPTIENRTQMLHDLEDYVKAQVLPDFDRRRKMKIQREYLGYVDCVTNKPEDRRKLLVTGVKASKRKSDGAVWAYIISTTSIGTGKTAELTVFKRTYESAPIVLDDIIFADSVQKNNRGYWNLLSYHILKE